MTRLIDADKLTADILALRDCPNGFSGTYDKACIIGMIEEQPTVDAHVWNPVAEKKPKPYEHVLVTVKGASHNFVETALYVPDLEKWDKNMYKGEHRSAWIVWDDVWYHYYELSDVIAWMPNIEPYEESEA